MELTDLIDTLLKDKNDYFLLDGDRYVYNGISVPRTTEIISKMIHEDYLMYWANSLGFKHKSYKKEVQKAADIGEVGHNLVESYLQTGAQEVGNPILDSFLLWWNNLNKNRNVTIVGIEQKLVCPWFGGTYDILLNIDGQMILVDLKTSNHVSYKYFLQLASYKYMLENFYNVYLDGTIILQLDKYEPSFEEYYLDLANPLHNVFLNQCCQTFLSLVYGFYNITVSENMYNQIF